MVVRLEKGIGKLSFHFKLFYVIVFWERDESIYSISINWLNSRANWFLLSWMTIKEKDNSLSWGISNIFFTHM